MIPKRNEIGYLVWMRLNFIFAVLLVNSLTLQPSQSAEVTRMTGSGYRQLNYLEAGPLTAKTRCVHETLGSLDLPGGEPLSLPPGRCLVRIELSRPAAIRGLSLSADGLTGTLSARFSLAANLEGATTKHLLASGDSLLQIDAQGTWARFIEVVMEASSTSHWHHLDVWAPERTAIIDGSHCEGLKPTTKVRANWMHAGGGAKLTYLHPCPATPPLRPSQIAFPESSDRERVAIYDFGSTRPVDQITSVHSKRPVAMRAYLLDSLPEKQDWRGRAKIETSDLAALRPAAAQVDEKGSGHLTLNLPSATKARYLAVVWVPDFNPPAFEVSNLMATGESTAAAVTGFGQESKALGWIAEAATPFTEPTSSESRLAQTYGNSVAATGTAPCAVSLK